MAKGTTTIFDFPKDCC